jgi:hypothetical protein
MVESPEGSATFASRRVTKGLPATIWNLQESDTSFPVRQLVMDSGERTCDLRPLLFDSVFEGLHPHLKQTPDFIIEY